jgi:septum formation protein
MEVMEIAEYLAIKKSKAYRIQAEEDVLITADTTVVLDNEVLNKPANREEAVEMLMKLQGRKHMVVTGVCVRTNKKSKSFTDVTSVKFGKITQTEALYYVDTFKPFDKAGSYGIQEWIGLNFIKKIKGSYHNVVGLPSEKLFYLLKTEFF